MFHQAEAYAIIISTTTMKNLAQTYRRWRGRYRRLRRLIFISPAEARFIELMGGKVVVLQRIRDKHTGFPAAVYWNLGKRLKAEGFKREVRYGLYFVDFANDLNRIIEIDGNPYHMDVVADMDRDIYIRELCWKWNRTREARIMRIPAHRLGLDKMKVQQEVLKFIYS